VDITAGHRQAALIVPALNEAPVIARTLASVPPGLFALVIVSDNGSLDGTAEAARLAGAVVVSQPERGYGAACLAAIAALPREIEAVVFMQADASEDPAEAAQLLAPLFDGRADLVLGSRVLGRADAGALLAHQRFGNWLATTLIHLIYGHRYSDLGPFRAIRVDALRRLHMRDRNYGWTVEMQIKALRHGLRVMEIPVRYGVRAGGENKVSGNAWASVKAGVKILWVVARSAI
jgi:glycosyltransferase involved in cell wall biosynthesis